MNPSEDAKTLSSASDQSAAPSTRPTRRTAIPPATPACPNHRGILRARQAASDEPTITVAADADESAATAGSPDRIASACRGRKVAPPSTTAEAKKPSGPNLISCERRLARNQSRQNAAAVSSDDAACRCSGPRSRAGKASATYPYPSAGRLARVTQRSYNINR